tara:strand:+ start:146 stop:535 length:390 start_codon:yes stop_codon:yes gene_type:complete
LNYLNNKSEFNIDGAELLINNDLFAPSIHCSYYSVFQSMICVYCSKNGITFEEYSDEAKAHQGSSHNHLIKGFCSLVDDKRASRFLKRKIDDLKASRIKSDYDNFQVDSAFSSRALSKAKELLLEFKNI